MKYNINDLKIIVNDKILDDIRKYYCLNTNYESQDVLGLLKLTGNKLNQTIVMITHNDEIAQMADRIIRIEDGKIVESRW